jgi:hypothetical protein
MHPQKEIFHAQQAERAGQRKQAARNQQHCAQRFDPKRHQRHGHSITSPRNRNFAIDEELTKPNKAISNATSKYMLLAYRIPKVKMMSSPLMYK